MIDGLSHLLWREPLWLWLALAPWLSWALRAIAGRSRSAVYAEPQLLPWARTATPASLSGRLQPRRSLRHALFALAWLLFAMAMAGPRLAEHRHQEDKSNDTQLILLLDLSRSMTARDLKPSRLERARLELEDLLARAERLRIGLVVYAGRPHLMVPPTTDKSVLRHALQLVRRGLMPTEGSDLPAAIEFAAQQFSPDPAARALLLVTDGELPAANEAALDAGLNELVSQRAQQGIALYALGVGTTDGEPLQDARGGWLQHGAEPVVTRLQQDRLQRLAAIGHGRYAEVADSDAEWRQLYDQHIRYLQPADADGGDAGLTEFRELYAWCLVPAVLLLLLAHLQPRPAAAGTAAPLWLIPILLAGTLDPSPAQAAAENWPQRAYQAYQQQAYQEARQAYARVAGYAGRMGEGSSAYRLEEYGEAAQLFTRAVLDADSDQQRARAIFNLANCRYRLEEYAAAAELYRETLRYAPEDRAADINLDLALAMQKRQERQQRRNDASGRPGRGPRSGTPPEDADLSGGGLSIDDAANLRTTTPPATSPPAGADRIEQSIYQSRPVVEQASGFEDPDWHYAATSPERILLQADALTIDESILWQRIFEGEEGFPAPLETTRELPGVLPW